jgi:O-antigen/teichoic acid export membrane protein
MKLLKSKLVRSLGIYTISNVINASIPFLLLPLLTNYLSTEDFGILTNFKLLIELLIPFISLNMMTSLQVVYVNRHKELGSYISSGMIAMVVLTALFSVLAALFSEKIVEGTGVPPSFVVMASVYALYQNVVEVLLSVWRMEDKAISFGVFRIARTVIELALALILILGFGLSFEGSIYALSYSYGLGTVVAIFFLVRSRFLPLSFEWRHVRHIFNYGAPLIPHVLGSVMIGYTDKLVITQYMGLSENGIYSVGFMVGQVIGLLQTSFNQAWVPYVFNGLKSGEEQVKVRIVRWTYIYMIAILAITLFFYLCTPLVFMFLGKGFQGGMELVLWIALGFAFNGMYKMVGVYFFYREKTNFIAVISILTAVINYFFVVWMVPHYGYTGAAIATMSAFFIQFLCTWIWSTRVEKMPWGNWKIWKK